MSKMTDKKTTDVEIIKALECCISDKDDVYLECPLQNDCFANADGNSEVKELALDLINRLQADVDNYKQIAENQQTISLDRGFEIKRLKEKVESLQAENERLERKNAVVLLKPENAQFENLEHFETRQISKEMLPAIVRRTKAEAYKEFAEQVKMAFYYEFDELIPSIMADKIDNLLKELVGEDNG